MSIMATIYHRGLKRAFIDEEIDLSSSKKIKRLRDYHQQEFEHRHKIKKIEVGKEYYCQVYLKLYRLTCKCTLDVLVKSTNDIIDDNDSILLAKTRIAKVIKPGKTLH